MPFFGVPIRNGLPIGLGSVAGFGVQQFDPSLLFEGGTVAGAWYDPSDLSTMFDSSAGTTPVAMPGLGAPVPVGLMLDKSQGLVLSANDITGFTPTIVGAATAATYNSTTGAGTAARVDGSNLSYLNKTGLTSNRVYRITVTNTGSSDLQIRQNGTAVGLFIVASGTTVTGLVTTYTHTDVSIVPITNGTTIAFTIVSFQQVSGNHAIAFNNTTARPELRARVNLLTYSEQFDNGAWTKTKTTVTANAAVSPDGTLSADELVNAPTTLDAAGIQSASASYASGQYTFSIYLKYKNIQFVQLLFSSVLSTNYVNADLVNGTITAGTYTSATITSVGNNWYRLSITTTFAAASGIMFVRFVDSGTAIRSATFSGAAGLSNYIWGADLRPANIGANVPAYQRIADALTYDTNGFPLYLRFDGIDDSMYTPANLNMSGTDKVAVFAGVRKLSDAANGVIGELSNAYASNNGAFVIRTGSFATTVGYLFASRGDFNPGTYADVTTPISPVTNVATGIGDIAGDSQILRLNGVQVASNTSDQGLGNLGTYPFYIGSRGNASTWFNGHLYSLVVAGSAVSAGNISATEQWVAGKTGLVLP